MPHTVSAATNLVDERLVANVAVHILNPRIRNSVARLWQNIHGNDARSPALQEHFDEPLADEAGRASDHAALWHGRKLFGLITSRLVVVGGGGGGGGAAHACRVGKCSERNDELATHRSAVAWQQRHAGDRRAKHCGFAQKTGSSRF